MNNNEIDSPLLEKKKENSGEYLWRVLKPAGCFLVLILFALYLIFCFTYKNDPAAPAEDVPAAVQETQPADN